MITDRRTFLQCLTTAAVAVTPDLIGRTGPLGEHPMYGLIAKLTAAPGKLDELIKILKDGTRNMPGCGSYILAKDVMDQNAIWVTEIWDSEANHDASLTLPAVKASIIQAKPLIAGFEKIAVTNPVGGVGFPATN